VVLAALAVATAGCRFMKPDMRQLQGITCAATTRNAQVSAANATPAGGSAKAAHLVWPQQQPTVANWFHQIIDTE
jgi:hypothetical protein